MPERRLLATVLTLVALGVTGCAGVPDHSKVHEGNPLPAAAAEDPLDIRLLVRAAAPGASPTAIVRGFLTASASFDGNHAVARTYLTAAAGRAWDADHHITIYDDNSAVPIGSSRRSGRATIVSVRAPELARIARDGAYSPSAATARLSADLRLVREDGEWRITNPPVGTMLTPLDVARSLEQLDLYFLARGLRTVVPDEVFLSASSTGRSTALIRALLAGPTKWLAPAVRTAIPGGTSLIGTAPVDDHGTVTVDLSRQVLDTTGDQRAQLSAQIVWTLRQLPDVARVRILVEGNLLEVPGVAEIQSRDAWASYDPDALPAGAGGYYRSGQRLLTLSGSPVPGSLGRPGNGVRHAALSPGSNLVGGLRRVGDGTAVVAGALTPGPRVVLRAGGTFTPPSWDARDEMWTVHRGSAPTVYLYRPARPLIRVPAPGLAGQDVRELRVSPDGSRVAVVVRSGAGGRVLLGRIRSNAGALRLDGFRPLRPDLSGVVDVAWSDARQVLVLGRLHGGSRQPWLVDVDGSDTTSLTPTGLSAYDAIAAAPGQPVLVGSAGQIFVARRGPWAVVGRGTEPAYRG